jgi:hypothetical protein
VNGAPKSFTNAFILLFAGYLLKTLKGIGFGEEKVNLQILNFFIKRGMGLSLSNICF